MLVPVRASPVPSVVRRSYQNSTRKISHEFFSQNSFGLLAAAGSEISSGMNAEEKRLMLKQSIEARYTRVNKLKAHALP